jgi:protein-S-isoprenylcysteine O-methyltransferase Ste14
MRAVALIVVVTLLALSSLALIWHGTREVALSSGAVLLLGALPLLAVSRRQLGEAFSVNPQAKMLVTHGLYSRIPHPMYAFLDLALLGVITMMRTPWLLIVWVGVIAVQAWQARREARVLQQAFGEAYSNYRKRTLW